MKEKNVRKPFETDTLIPQRRLWSWCILWLWSKTIWSWCINNIVYSHRKPKLSHVLIATLHFICWINIMSFFNEWNAFQVIFKIMSLHTLLMYFCMLIKTKEEFKYCQIGHFWHTLPIINFRSLKFLYCFKVCDIFLVCCVLEAYKYFSKTFKSKSMARWILFITNAY